MFDLEKDVLAREKFIKVHGFKTVSASKSNTLDNGFFG